MQMLTARDETPLPKVAHETGIPDSTLRRMVLKREVQGRQDERGRWYIDSSEIDRLRKQQLERYGVDDEPFDFVRAIAEQVLPTMDPIFMLEDGTRITRDTQLADELTVRQMHQYRADALKAGIQTGGNSVFVPLRGLSRGVDSVTSTTGGPFKFTQPGDFVSLLRNRSSVLRAGATVITGLEGPLSLPRQTAPGVATWRAENPGSDLGKNDFATDSVTLSFKTVQSAMAVSRQALFSAASGNFDLRQVIMNDLAAVIGIAMDLAGLNGLGSSNQPLGILQDTSVGTDAAGTNGATLTAAMASQMKREVAEANAENATTAWVTNARVREKAEQTAGAGGTASTFPLWIDGGDGDGTILGRRAIVSSQVPRNLTKGTSTTVCSALVFGPFEHLLIGTFGPGLELIVDPFELKLQNMISITAKLHCDVANRHPTAFRKMVDLLTN